MAELEHIVDAVRTGNGDGSVRLVCATCGEDFDHEPRFLTFGSALHRVPDPDICGACAKQVLAEADEREESHRFETAMRQYRDGHRGSRLEDASFADFIQGPHNAAARATAWDWIEELPQPNLLVVGPVASGKSYLAACVYNALLADYRPAFWLNAGSLMAKIKRGFQDKDAAADANWRMERAEQAPVLVLDDLGKVHPGKDVSWVEEIFYAIVEARYRNELPTIVTTEWKSTALSERVGESVVSRLNDGAWVAGMKAPAIPYRRPHAQSGGRLVARRP